MSLTWRLYRDDGLILLFQFAVIAKIAPYRLATGTHSLLTTGTTGRMASPVTQTPSIAVPLGVMVDAFCDYDFKNGTMIFPGCMIMTTIYSKSTPTSYFKDK
jgi:hypothetical protein